MQWTEQQLAIVGRAAKGDDVKVLAYAGTGKTTTLVGVAEALPRRRVLYLAFNRAIAEEAARRFPDHVDCRTAHSLAFREVGRLYADRLANSLWAVRRELSDPAPPEIKRLDGYRTPPEPGQDVRAWERRVRRANASAVLHVVEAFLRSADPEPRYVPRDVVDLAADPRMAEEWKRDLLRAATWVWDRLSNPGAQWPVTHDVYLKLWQLSNPELPYNTLLFDEAQDADPVISAVVAAQEGTQRVYVGDQHQQIYAWRGAVDALRRFQAVSLPLSQSWRFGPNIAEMANRVLVAKGEAVPLEGLAQFPGLVTDLADPDPIGLTELHRTNAGLVASALKHLDEGRRPAVVGGTASLAKLLEAAHELWSTGYTSHPELSVFGSWDELLLAVQEGQQEYAPLTRLVEQYGSAVPSVADRLRREVVGEEQADVILSTAHKAKGRQWARIVLRGFASPVQVARDEQGNRVVVGLREGEANLLYVSMTRAQRELHLAGLQSTLIADLEELAGTGKIPAGV